VQAIAQAARRLVEQRQAWLNPPGLGQAERQKRTLTALYNARPTWLDNLHRALDQAVLAAYGWLEGGPDGPGEEEILERLLRLNGVRARG